MFYLSEYLEANRDEYYLRLRKISEEQDWDGWITFFLQAIIVQAKENCKRVKAIMSLYDNMKSEIGKITHSQYSVYLLDVIFNKPVFKTSDCASLMKKEYNIHNQTTSGLLRQLKKAGILKEIQGSSGRRAAILCFPKLINLAEGRKVL